AQEAKKDFTVAEIYNSTKFFGESLQGVHWSKSGKYFYYIERDKETRTRNFMKYDIATGKRSLFLAGKDIKLPGKEEPFRFQHAIWSPDESHLLFTETLPARRIKTGGNFYLFDIQTKKLKQLTNTDQKQVNVQFSPDGKAIAFVRNNNLFYMDLESGEEKQLTFDGQEHVLNGHFDWVYEEEFSIIVGWQWSPDGHYIAYWHLDERRVPEFNIVQYDSLHLNWNRMRYPKAGDPNSIVKIGVVDVRTGKNIWMDIGKNDDIYIPRIKWFPTGDRLAILRLNRLQNKGEILVGDIKTGHTEIIFTESDSAWLEVENQFVIFVNKGKQFLWTSERDGFNHIYLYDITRKSLRQLTRGKWEVRSIVDVDEKRHRIYFTATKDSPLENHLYSIDFKGKKLRKLTRTPGWHSVDFSPTHDYYIDRFSQADTPTKVGLFSREGKLKAMLVENPMTVLKEYRRNPTEFFSFKTSDGVTLNGWMIKPLDFDESKQYPVLMYVYGGPGSQTVVNRWRGSLYLWFELLAQKGYLVASVDGRGTGARGAAFKKVTYKNLGYWETHDQIEAAKYLASLPYVDKNRIGIFGWSYGGYMSSLCLFKGNDVFKTAVAVAPVTHWKFYDTIYTERYMQTPQLNPEGYEKSAPLTYAKDLKGNYLVIHGTSDDNVHFQNTVALVNELIAHKKQFQTMFYPGRYHGIRRGKNTREHLFTLITNFLLKNL
ncbi:MAG: S9 family peptidase, partial [Calditrichaeota bacterium]